MPAILAFLRAFASTAFLYPLIARVLVGIGVTSAAYAGFNALMSSVVAHVLTSLEGLPAVVVACLTIANVPKAISLMLSAYAARLVLKGVTELGVLRRVTWTGQGPIVAGS